MKFDIVIPTYNNLSYLKNAIYYIKKNSRYDHDIYVHVNEGVDGTIDYLKNENIPYTYHKKNTGVCLGTNKAAKLGNNDYICYFNDDMVALPDWDYFLSNMILKLKNKPFFIASTPIEPIGKNPNCIISDFGRDISSFNYNNLISKIGLFRNKLNNLNTTWSPFVVRRIDWDKIGGYTVEYEPGFGSDPDLCKKLYNIGCRDYVGVGKSLIYHFVSKSTSRVKKNNSRHIFKSIHGIDLDHFVLNILKRGKQYQCLK